MARVRQAQPQIGLASDFIVGFPGESDKDFEDTMALVREVNFCIAYSFKYSARPGTPAAEMFGQVPEDVKTTRLHALQALLWEQQTAFNLSKIGQSVPVLVTGKGRMPGQMAGRSPWLQSVYFDGDESLNGKIVDLKIDHATQNSISGQLLRVKEVAV